MRIGNRPKKKNALINNIMPLLLFVALLAGGYQLFRDTQPPELTIEPAKGTVTLGIEFTITATDLESGIKELTIEVVQDGRTRERIEQLFSTRTPTHIEKLRLDKELYQDGPIEITAQATDSSLYPFGSGSLVTMAYVLDSVKPKLTTSSRQLNLTQGGCGILSYTVNENILKSGIRVGPHFFPGYQQEDGSYLCLFAMPHNTGPSEFKPQLIALDLAGNGCIKSIRYHANARHYRNDRINLSDSFLISKEALFKRYFPNDPETDPLGRYIKINNKLRQKNRARLKKIGLRTNPAPLFNNAFLRTPGKTTARFAENRDYYYHGVPVDNQTHLGFDIASVKNAPVASAAPGKVVLAEFFGIYGNCVIVDHGLGLQTLYSHLSEITVSPGQEMNQGDLLGHTGKTGLAGGDHLHFGVLVSGLPVNPKEWWDKTWMKNNILSKLSD